MVVCYVCVVVIFVVFFLSFLCLLFVLGWLSSLLFVGVDARIVLL